MDQIVFVFDLEQVVPLEKVVGALDDSLIEARLSSVKQAALRIATFCFDAGRIDESSRDLPSFGFRLELFTSVHYSISSFVQILQLHRIFLCPSPADRRLA